MVFIIRGGLGLTELKLHIEGETATIAAHAREKKSETKFDLGRPMENAMLLRKVAVDYQLLLPRKLVDIILAEPA